MAKGFGDLPASAQAGIVAALIVAAAAGAFYYLVWPLSTEIATLKKKADGLEAENKKNEAFRDQKILFERQIDEDKKKLETLRTIVPDVAETDKFITMVYDSGRSAGTWIRTFTAQAPIVHDFYVELPYAVHVDAAYYSLLRFFEGLSRGQRIASVTGLVLGGLKGGGGAFNLSPDETVDASFTLTTYYNKPGGPPAPGAAPR